MATRSRIGIAREDGKIESIYCHWDGYPTGNGKILLEHYQDEEKVNELIGLGDLSILGPEIGEQHSFDERMTSQSSEEYRNKVAPWCCAYGRDRGENDTGPEISNNKQEFIDLTYQSDGEYSYLFENGEWFVRGVFFVKLDEAIKQDEA